MYCGGGGGSIGGGGGSNTGDVTVHTGGTYGYTCVYVPPVCIFLRSRWTVRLIALLSC